MSKQEFLGQLRKALSGLPQRDVEERLIFYSEMIEDRMEEGLSEEDAVLAVGAVDEIVAQIVTDTPFAKIAKESIRPKRRLGSGELVLLILGSPVWLSLCIAAFAVVLSLYISLWSVILSLWAVFASLALCAVVGVLACIVLGVYGHGLAVVAALAAGIVCVGLSLLMFCGCRAATKGSLALTKQMGVWIKKRFMRKRAA